MTAVALALPSTEALATPRLTSVVGLASLRTQLQEVVAGGRTAGSPWATGVRALDAALGGGIPRGRLTEVVGPLGIGKTALVKQVVSRVLRTGGWVAWIDAKRTLAAAPWAGLGDRLVMIRPRDTKRSAWCADLLLRSGVFALVVIDGAPALSRVHGVRLAQLARERDAACVVLNDNTHPSRISGAVRLKLQPLARHASRGFSVIVEKGGPTRSIRSVEVNSDIVMARRVCTDSEIPDRRGVARGTRRPWAAIGGSSDHTADHPITWGGLGVSANDDIHTPARKKEHPHRDTTRAGVRGTDRGAHAGEDNRERDRTHEREGNREHERARFDREFDKHTRDWTRYRGRRRMAESTFGKPTRRDRAREKVGASLGPHGGQGGVRHGAPRLGRDSRHDTRHDSTSREIARRTTYPAPSAALGRVAEGVGR